MSISAMKKLSVFAYTGDTDSIIKRLVKLRCVGFESAISDENALKPLISTADSRVAELSTRLADIDKVLLMLAKYGKRKKSLLSPRIKADLDVFESDGRLTIAASAVDKTLELADFKKSLDAEESSLGSKIDALLPWETYGENVNCSGTESTTLMLGSFPLAIDLDTVNDAVDSEGLLTTMQPISLDSSRQYVRVIAYNSATESTLKLLTTFGFVKASFADLDGTASSMLTGFRKRLVSIEGERLRTEEQLDKLADELDNIEIYYDYIATCLESENVKLKLAKTRNCAYMSGWVPADTEEKVVKVLGNYECAYDFAEPDENDDVPIHLENNAYAENFEWVLGMYSYPKYGKFDPTFIMSIFFFIIFGLMFADVCYGLLISVACFVAVKLMKPAAGKRHFLMMFGYCGLSSLIMGILFGGYFGDLPQQIASGWFGKELPSFALVLDPLTDPVMFLAISIGVGFIHIVTGMAIKFYMLCKSGDVFAAIFDVASWWVIFAGIGLYILIGTPGAIVAVLGVLMILCTAGREKKGIFGKIIGGFSGLYSIISYASDLLSYSRILALGLSSIVIAQVVNMLGTMAGPTVGGFILFIIAFLIGHAINIALNILGAFVHTSRLQYVEFFNKFYEDGGREFKPSMPSEKYTME